MKKYTLIRYNRTTGVETSRLRMHEPEGFRDMEEVLKRDGDVHGVFFSYSSEISLFNYYYTNEQTGLQVVSEAYNYIKQAYNEEGTNVSMQLIVEQDQNTIFDLYLNFESFQDNPLDQIWATTAETKTPFLLKERQEQKVIVNAYKQISIPARDVIRPANSTVNPSQNTISTGFTTNPFTPAFQWEDINAVNGLKVTDSFDSSEILYKADKDWLMDYNIGAKFTAFSLMWINVPIFQIRGYFEIIVKDSNGNQIYINTATQLPVLYPNGVLSLSFYSFTLNGSFFIPKNSEVYVNFRAEGTASIEYRFSNIFNPDIPIFSNLDSFLNLSFHDVFGGSPCTGSLLKDAFQDVLSFHGFNLSSTALDDTNDLGSIFLTLGRRIARGTEDIDIVINFKDLFEQSQKLFNLGYAIGDSGIAIETIDAFYDQNTTFVLGQVNKMSITLFSQYNYNVFKCGYNKYKEDALGKIYENESFNSKREYNLPYSRFESKLDVESDFIASNFVIEKLRRDIEKQDDDELFLIALNRSPITSTLYSSDATEQTYAINEVSEGYEAFDDPSNDYGGLDKQGLLNIRLSPRRIAQRWARVLKTALYKLPANEQVANFITGEPKLNFITDNLDEKEGIDLSTVDFLFIPEQYRLDTYLSSEQFTDLKQNYLYSKMQFEYAGQTYAGFVLEVKYNHRTLIAEMTLIGTLT